MKKPSTIEKEKIILQRFHQLLRSGRDYTTEYMYKVAGAKCFIEGGQAGNIIRAHYNSIISTEMLEFVLTIGCVRHDERILLFSKRFKLCVRESRLIIRYINRRIAKGGDDIIDLLK